MRTAFSGALLLTASLVQLGCATTSTGARALTGSVTLANAVGRVPLAAAAEQVVRPVESAAFVAYSVRRALARESGGSSAALAQDLCPPNMALLPNGTCIDRWEASLVIRASAGRTERPWSPYLAVDGHEHGVRAVSMPGVVPQAYISGRQAALACQASGKRLCSAHEWVGACRGPENHVFPYGDDRRALACNDDSRHVHPVIEAASLLGIPATNAFKEGMNEGIINQLENTLLPTGSRPDCTNAYGVFDMVGNLHEWIDDAEGTFRGGYYMDTTKNGDGCSYQTTAHDFAYHDYSTGFRCCMDAEVSE